LIDVNINHKMNIGNFVARHPDRIRKIAHVCVSGAAPRQQSVEQFHHMLMKPHAVSVTFRSNQTFLTPRGNTMSTGRPQRHKALLDHLSESGAGSIDELCRRFDVSEMTIRRDLSELEKEGLLVRTHGGAKLKETAFFEMSFTAKATQFVNEKKRIAERAAEMVYDGDRIIIDSGTTTGHFARCLKDRRLSVVTNALNVATDLIEGRQIDLHFCGGALRRGLVAAVGQAAAKFFDSVRCDRLFMGVDGIDAFGTMTVPDVEEALVKQSMMRAAREVIVLADHSKLGRNSLGVIETLPSITALITGKEADPSILAALREFTNVIAV
jgi:DeoR family fructose operon transcriptional repressor